MATKKPKKEVAEHVDLRKLPRDKRPKPSTGQSAPERKIEWGDFNRHEKAVLKMLNGDGGRRVQRSVEFLADGIPGDPDNPKLAARNALRRPVSSGWVDRVGKAQYMISESGRRRYQAK